MKKNITKMKNLLKVSLITVFFVSGSFVANAAANIDSGFKEGILTVEGVCDKDVVIELFSDKEMSEIIYSAGAVCKGGRFSFSDNLKKWNIVDGSYVLAIDGRRIKDEKVEMKKEKKDEDIVIRKESEENKDETEKDRNIVADDFEKVESDEEADSKFDKATENLKESMEKMGESLEAMDKNYSESKYAGNSFVRTIIDLMKETFRTISGLFAQFVVTQVDNGYVQNAESTVAKEGVDTDFGVSVQPGEVHPVNAE